MAVVLTVPQATIPAGSGSFVSPVIAAAATKLTVSFSQVSWPFAGDKALDYWIDVSQDGGSNWALFSSGDVSDLQAAGSAFSFGVVGLPGAGSANRKVRVRYNFAKALTVSGSLDVS